MRPRALGNVAADAAQPPHMGMAYVGDSLDTHAAFFAPGSLRHPLAQLTTPFCEPLHSIETPRIWDRLIKLP